MDLVVSRKGSATVQAQLAAQIEMKIMAGELRVADKLPSVRALARRLKIHPNTVSAVYQRLTRDGWLDREHGSGLYVRRGAPSEPGSPQMLQDLLRSALHMAFRQGYEPAAVRAAVLAWLDAPPPTRVVVVETNQETADLVAHEIAQRVPVPVSSRLLDAVMRESLPRDALAVTWPFHLEPLRRVVRDEALVGLTLRLSAEDTHAVAQLPKGAMSLVVSQSPAVLKYALWLLTSARGDDTLVRGYLLEDAATWRALLPGAEIVFADARAWDVVKAVAGRRAREMRLVTDDACAVIRQRLAFALPTLRPLDSARADA